MSESRAFVCAYCAAVGVSMRYCSACKTTTYCSLQCQKKDWQKHQLVCGQTTENEPEQPEAPAAAAATPEPTPAAAAKAPATAAPEKAAEKAAEPQVQQIEHKPLEDEQLAHANKKEESFFTSTGFLIGATATVLAAVGGALYFYLGSSSDNAPQDDAPKPKKSPKRPQRR
eukprot:UN04515